MGWNTTVVVLNDALGSIESDPKFGAKLVSAIREASLPSCCPVDVSAGNHCNAALVVESHHADSPVMVKVWRNEGVIVQESDIEANAWNSAIDRVIAELRTMQREDCERLTLRLRKLHTSVSRRTGEP